MAEKELNDCKIVDKEIDETKNSEEESPREEEKENDNDENEDSRPDENEEAEHYAAVLALLLETFKEQQKTEQMAYTLQNNLKTENLKTAFDGLSPPSITLQNYAKR